LRFHLNKKNITKIIIGTIFLIIVLIVYNIRQHKEEIAWHNQLDLKDTSIVSDDIGFNGETNMEVESIIVVDVDGEVKIPSVYTFSSRARVYEAIDAAGGLTDSADTRNTNLAAPLSDGMKLFIPSKEDVAEEQRRTGEAPGAKYIGQGKVENSSGEGESSSGLININTADSTELQKLSGVGPSTAEKIITYRKEYGGYKKIEELMNVSGIGEKTFNKLKNSIRVE
jgi:competence protein ComEA